jgi:hypothetical protein
MKRVAVAVGVDFGSLSIWIHSKNKGINEMGLTSAHDKINEDQSPINTLWTHSKKRSRDENTPRLRADESIRNDPREVRREKMQHNQFPSTDMSEVCS